MKERSSNIELLRIFSMLLVIAHHLSYFSFGGVEFAGEMIYSINQQWVYFLRLGGKIGVNIFVLISGYFLVDSSKTKVSKLIKLWLQIFFYSVFSYIICVFAGVCDFTKEDLKRNMLPIMNSEWWFASTYFVLFLFVPYINILLNKIDKKTYQKMLIIMTVCWCLIPTFFDRMFEGNNLIWFVYIYCLSGYIKRYKDNIKIKSKYFFGAAIILTVITLITRPDYFLVMQYLVFLLISLFCFLGFKNLKIKNSKVINTISSATFGVYLIHEDEYVRSFLWHTIFKGTEFAGSAYLIPYSLVIIFAVFIVCATIELIRINVLERNYMKLVVKYEPNIESYIEKFFDSKLVGRL